MELRKRGRPKGMQKTERLEIRVSPLFMKFLNRLCERGGYSQSDIVIEGLVLRYRQSALFAKLNDVEADELLNQLKPANRVVKQKKRPQ